MSKNHFGLRDENGLQYIESDMHCSITDDSKQLLMWLEYFPNGDKWIFSTEEDMTPLQARARNKSGTWDEKRCGWFPVNPVNWCRDVFCATVKCDYSDFLKREF